MALNDLTGQNIQDTYQKVVQTDGTNLADGTGSLLPISFDGNNVAISGSLTATRYILSSSVTHMTIANLSGSSKFGDTVDDTHRFIGNITASNAISASGGFIGDITTIRNVTNAEFHPVFVDSANPELTPETLYTSNSSLTYNPSSNVMTLGQIIASGNISSSGYITATNITASGNISASGVMKCTLLDAVTLSGRIDGGTF
tara:strand:- start:619 stop:1224 length:606 start_codon:yes stop_codon:yes gene_type:complete